jgi:hypothetical protein
VKEADNRGRSGRRRKIRKEKKKNNRRMERVKIFSGIAHGSRSE